MSRILPDRTLAVHQKVSEDNLPDRLESFALVKTKGEGGMVNVTTGARRTVCGCRMIPAGELDEIFRNDAVELDARWAVVVPLSADVKVGYRVVVTSATWKRTLDVIGTSNPRTQATMRHFFVRDVK